MYQPNNSLPTYLLLFWCVINRVPLHLFLPVLFLSKLLVKLIRKYTSKERAKLALNVILCWGVAITSYNPCTDPDDDGGMCSARYYRVMTTYINPAVWFLFGCTSLVEMLFIDDDPPYVYVFVEDTRSVVDSNGIETAVIIGTASNGPNKIADEAEDGDSIV